MAVLHGHFCCIVSTLPDQLEVRKSDTTFPRNPWWLHRSSEVRTTSVDESKLILSCLHHYHLAVTWTRRVVYCYVSLSELSTGQIRPTPPYLLDAPDDIHPHQSFINTKYKISDQPIMARLPISMLRIGLSVLHMPIRLSFLLHLRWLPLHDISYPQQSYVNCTCYNDYWRHFELLIDFYWRFMCILKASSAIHANSEDFWRTVSTAHVTVSWRR